MNFDPNIDDRIQIDAMKVVKVFDSCITKAQYDVAKVMRNLFIDKYLFRPSSNTKYRYFMEMINEAQDACMGRVFMPL
jgi:hypothetical protein